MRSSVPEFVRVAIVADVCSMPVDETRDLLRGTGALVRHSGQRFWVRTARLRDALPDAYTRLYERYVLEAEEARRVDR